MKPIHTASSFGLDRLATWNERMRAISVSSKGVLALDGADGDFLEMDSAFKGRACNLLEDDMVVGGCAGNAGCQKQLTTYNLTKQFPSQLTLTEDVTSQKRMFKKD